MLVGESDATRELGLKGNSFGSQEYLIRFLPDTLILMGRDWQDTEANRQEAGIGTTYESIADLRVEINYGQITGTSSMRQIKMYHEDGVRGLFLCGIGEQVDYYVTMKLLDDPGLEVDDILAEFFIRYYGAAAEPMKRLHLRIEEIYSDPDSYPDEVRTEERQFHQNEEIAWKYLGTEERMVELGELMQQAKELAQTDTEKKRVQLFERGVWEYMVTGREKYLAR